MTNVGATAAMQAKLMLQTPVGSRILAAPYDDNDISPLPGETRALRITYPAAATGPYQVALNGYNVPSSIA